MNNILIIEDEVKLSKMLKKAFENEGFYVDVAYDGLKGKLMALENRHDAIILDILMPLINGYDVCREIRKNNVDTPIIMLTAIGSMENKLAGFDVGADDYMCKPFEFKELLARINVLLKRTNAINENDVILKFADLEMNLNRHEVTRSGQLVQLTQKEFDLLTVLMQNKGNIVTKAELSKKVWGVSFNTGTNVVEVSVSYLRKKIDKDFPVKLIHTVVGIGYVIREDGNES